MSSDFIIGNDSLQLKKEIRAIAKNKGITYGRLLRELFKEIALTDGSVGDTGISTGRGDFIVKNESRLLKQKIELLAAKYKVSASEYLRGKIITFVETQPKESKSYFEDSE